MPSAKQALRRPGKAALEQAGRRRGFLTKEQQFQPAEPTSREGPAGRVEKGWPEGRGSRREAAELTVPSGRLWQ